MPCPPSRERRWLALLEDGRFAWQGRARDPGPDDLELLDDVMRQHGLRGWLAVSEGRYYSDNGMTLMQVRPMNAPTGDWAEAVAAFHRMRAAAREDR